MENKVYKQKQQWIEEVMASSLTPATKVFAFGIFTRMYGDKVTSFPSEVMLSEDTGLARSKFTTYRKALIDGGYVTAEKSVKRKGGRPSYEYTLVLSPEGRSNVPSGDVAMSPEGTTNVPTGSGNTTSNTTREYYKKDSKVVADAPTFPLPLSNKGDDDFSLSTFAPSLEGTAPLVKTEKKGNVPTGDVRWRRKTFDEKMEEIWG